MDSRCIQLKAAMKEESKRHRFPPDTEMRISSLGSQLVRLQQGLITAAWIPLLFNQYTRLLQGISSLTTYEIVQLIQETEDLLIEFLVMDFRMPRQAFSQFLSSARNSQGQSVDEVLPRFLATMYRQSQLFTGQTISLPRIAFLDFWGNITDTFRVFQIEPNNFVKCVAKKVICTNASINDRECLVELTRLEEFMGLFFGGIKNYKFYSKISKIYSIYFEQFSMNRYEQRLGISLTSVRKEYTGPQTLGLNRPLEVGASGLMGNTNRGDGLVIFGRHPHADMVFPETEKYVDLVSLLLYNGNGNYYIVDCSKRGCCGFKLENQKNYLLKPGFLINLAKNLIYKIERIEFEEVAPTILGGDSPVTFAYEEEEKEIHSTLTLQCLEGPYKDTPFRLTTRTREGPRKINYMLGCGGGGEAPDLYIPKETGVSKRHCELIFDNGWHAYDRMSLNGTFLLFKTFDQYHAKSHSNSIPLFASEAIQSIIIMISKYIFIIAKI